MLRQPFFLTFALIAGLSACAPSHPDADSRAGSQAASQASGDHADPSKIGAMSAPIASLPDRGELLRYPAQALRPSAAVSAPVPVSISEEHALAAIQRKELVLEAPDGVRSRVAYARHEDHGDGNWTWVGRSGDGGSALLTFGQNAVFGSIQRADGSEMRIVTQNRRTYAVLVRPDQLRGVETSTGSDALVVPDSVSQASARTSDSGQSEQIAAGATATATAAAANEIDVLLGYSTGLAQRIGSASGAETRMQNLVAISNQAYENSGVVYRIRLVGTVQVAYGDSTRNDSTLHALTGSTGTGSAPIDPAFNALRAAREQTGADLVSFVRQFREPEQDGCGIAWLLGGGQTVIDQSDAPFAYSVVSDGSDVRESDNRTYFCREETLAHELGHSMGQAHNQEDSTSAGRHAYSYGYREASTSGFYTIMAYRIADSNQVAIRYFANPNVLFDGRATGVANQSDNARSMNETLPIIAQFRASVLASSPPNLYVVNRISAGATDMGYLGGAANYSQLTAVWRSGLHETGSGYAWVFRVGDRTGDGVPDMYVLKKQGSLGRLEVHILSGVGGFSQYVLHALTPLVTGLGNRWMLDLGDYNRDGVLDLYAIDRMGASNTTEVHVLNGADGFQTFLLHAATALHPTGTDLSWAFEVGDLNGDRSPDVFAIKRNGARGLEVHVLSGASNFSSWLLHAATPLGPTGTSNDWDFKLGDYNRDGVPDLYVISKMGASGTEAHVIGSAGGYAGWIAHLPTGLGRTGTDARWVFDIPN